MGLFFLLAGWYCTCVRAQVVDTLYLDHELSLLTRVEEPRRVVTGIDSLLYRYPDLDSGRLVRALLLRADAWHELTERHLALPDYATVYAYARRTGDSLLRARTARLLGVAHSTLGNLSESQRYLLEATELYGRIGSEMNRTDVLSDLAVMYTDLGRDSLAVAAYREAMESYRTLADTAGQSMILINLALHYIENEAAARAEPYLLEQGRLDSLRGNREALSYHYDLLAVVRREMGNPEEALRLSRRGLELRRELGNVHLTVESRFTVAECLHALGRNAEAREHALAVLDYGRRYDGLHQQANALELLAKTTEGSGDYRRALAYHRDYKEMMDSIYRMEQLREIAIRNSLYQRSQQEAEIARLDRLTAASTAKLLRRNTALVAALIGLILLSVFTGTVLWLLGRIRAQKAGLQSLNDQKELLLREVHHRVKNNLQTISSLLSLQSDYIEDPAALEAMERGRQRVRSMAIIHQKLYLRDSGEPDLSARTYLEQLLEELLDSLSAPDQGIELNTRLEDIRLDVDRLISLGLIVNEAVTNSIKHAFAGRRSGTLEVDLRREGRDVLLRIADNGSGTTESQVTQANTFGSFLIRTFAEQLNGTVWIDGRRGTEVVLRFPV